MSLIACGFICNSSFHFISDLVVLTVPKHNSVPIFCGFICNSSFHFISDLVVLTVPKHISVPFFCGFICNSICHSGFICNSSFHSISHHKFSHTSLKGALGKASQGFTRSFNPNEIESLPRLLEINMYDVFVHLCFEF